MAGDSIFANSGLGIDLDDGRTANDPRDAVPNNLQNFPVLTSAFSIGDGKFATKGTLESTPSTKKKKRAFTIQLFSNPQADPSSFDEGKTFLGQTRVTTNRRGRVPLIFVTTRPIPDGDGITATATGRVGTSEFSDPVKVDLALE